MSSAAAGAIRDEIQALTAYISRQKLLLDEMQTRLQNLQLRLDSFTYPISTLPPEITCAIFLLCLPEERRTDVVNPKEAPLLLTHICRGWRQIAISLPPLWTRFEVVHPIELPDLSNILKTWFKRSQNSRISVKVHGRLAKVNNFRSILKTLSQHSQRMSTVELQVDLEHLHKLNVQLSKFPLLQKLCVRLFENEAALDSEAIQMFNGNVPLLTEVSLGRASPSLVTLPWQQLTKFTGDLYTVRQCLEALHCMPNIVECTFSVPIDDLDDDPLLFSHSNIQHFSLLESRSDLGARTDSRLLEFIIFPALQTLEICTDEFNELELAGFIELSQPPLRRLSIHPRDLDGGTGLDFRPSFAELPLTELEIWHPSETILTVFFHVFSHDASFLTQLQSLSLLGCRAEEGELTGVEILRMAATSIMQRRGLTGCALLQSFRVVEDAGPDTVHIHPWYPAALLLPFRELTAAGMDVYIGTDKTSALEPKPLEHNG